MIRLSDIRFTRYNKPTSYHKEEYWDVLLVSGPQFVISQNDFNQINEILMYESEEVDRLTVYGKPWFMDADWGKPVVPDDVKKELVETLSRMNFAESLAPIPVLADENIEDDKMVVKSFEFPQTTESKIADIFASFGTETGRLSSGKESSDLDAYNKPKSYPRL